MKVEAYITGKPEDYSPDWVWTHSYLSTPEVCMLLGAAALPPGKSAVLMLCGDDGEDLGECDVTPRQAVQAFNAVLSGEVVLPRDVFAEIFKLRAQR